MTKGELIDEHVSVNQSKTAVDALVSHASKVQETKAQTELLPGKEHNVWLMVTVKQMNPEKKLKPYKIPIVHPIVDPRVSSVCLITKDPQREYKDLLETHGIRFISRVVGIEKLKGKFKPFEARRMLLKENDLFLADERVVPLLPGLLGSKFFDAKKQPIPVCLTRKDLKGELERAISSTYFHQNQGTCTSVKIGTVSQPASKILDNLKMALPAIVKRIKGEWDNIQSFHIKTNSSVSLPIWSCDLSATEGGRWDGLVAESEAESGAEQSEDESAEGSDEEAIPAATLKTKPSKKHDAVPMDVDDVSPLPKDHVKGKGKKRAAEDAASSTPQKKAKADRVPAPATKATPDKAAAAHHATSAVPPSSVTKTRRLSVSTADAAAPPTAILSAADDASGKKRRKRKAATDGDAATSGAPATTAPGEARAVPPASAQIPEDGSTKKRKKIKGAAGEAAQVSVVPTEAVPVLAPAPAPAADASETTTPTKARKRKHARDGAAKGVETEVDAATVAPPTPSQSATESTDNVQKKKQRKKTKAAADSEGAQPSAPATPVQHEKEHASSEDGPAEPATPASPSIVKKKRKRASAVDFFIEDGTPAEPSTAVPPNTPAAGLKQSKALAATPLKSALKQVTATDKSPAKTGEEDTPAKKPRKRKSKVGLSSEAESAPAAAAAPVSAPVSDIAPSTSDVADGESSPPKKAKRKHKKAVAESAAPETLTSAAAPASESTTPTADELKKKRSAAGGEKKKAKALGAGPAAKSAKDAVLGKKHV